MSTGSVQAFQPIFTATVAASTTSAAAAFPANADTVLVYNASAAIAFVQLGATSTSAATGCPVPPGARQLFDSAPSITGAAVVLASGTGAVYFTSGLGTAY